MKWWRLLLVAAAVVGCGPGGDGDVVSCSCSVYDSEASIMADDEPDGFIPISLCETSFTEDHTPDAEAECSKIALSDVCLCSCVHLTERCDTQ
jgi:hypothetical protein